MLFGYTIGCVDARIILMTLGVLITMILFGTFGYLMGRTKGKGQPKNVSDLEYGLAYRVLGEYRLYRIISSYNGIEILELPRGTTRFPEGTTIIVTKRDKTLVCLEKNP